MIAAATPYPVTIYPDIAIPGRYWPGIHYIGRLIGDIAIDRTTSDGKTACYSND
jgi:hypothetical protein